MSVAIIDRIRGHRSLPESIRRLLPAKKPIGRRECVSERVRIMWLITDVQVQLATAQSVEKTAEALLATAQLNRRTLESNMRRLQTEMVELSQ